MLVSGVNGATGLKGRTAARGFGLLVLVAVAFAASVGAVGCGDANLEPSACVRIDGAAYYPRWLRIDSTGRGVLRAEMTGESSQEPDGGYKLWLRVADSVAGVPIFHEFPVRSSTELWAGAHDDLEVPFARVEVKLCGRSLVLEEASETTAPPPTARFVDDTMWPDVLDAEPGTTEVVPSSLVRTSMKERVWLEVVDDDEFRVSGILSKSSDRLVGRPAKSWMFIVEATSAIGPIDVRHLVPMTARPNSRLVVDGRDLGLLLRLVNSAAWGAPERLTIDGRSPDSERISARCHREGSFLVLDSLEVRSSEPDSP